MFKTLSHLVGWTYFPLAIAAKLPYAMVVVAVMTSVSATSGSYSQAGATAALVGLGTAVSGPAFGAVADRFGQRTLLIVTAILNGAAIFALAWALRAGAAPAVVLIIGLLIGLSAPQASSMVRSRWLQAIGREIPEADRPRATNKVLSYESMTDEFMFVIGPVVVGVVAMLAGVVVPLDFGAALTVVGVILFAVHPSVRFTRVLDSDSQGRGSGSGSGPGSAAAAPAEGAAPTPAGASAASPPLAAEPASAMFRLRILLPIAGMFSIGFFFGATLPTLTDFLDTLGQADRAGVYYGVLGVGSAALALGSQALPESFSLRNRWLATASLALLGTFLFVGWNTLPGLLAALIVMGCGIGPSLVNLYSIAALMGPRGRTTTVMATMATMLTVGQAVSSALVGRVIDAQGYHAGGWLCVGAMAALLVFGLVNHGETAKLRRQRTIVA
ncbi:MFS transporter [Brevibacterium moorei]|uniref:MFS transporter n=1 Tax=Brevibacterium moorei TaxID=2968457 RepID=UPI00211C0A76|nr:MFS transporter [Brevibacterium sp. 68QC2CO]MCQ9386532.1 MFS transporter [Brevibacterium sp. 68QC2CO]